MNGLAGHQGDPRRAGARRRRPLRLWPPRPLIVLTGFSLIVACLYWAQALLIPVALSILLTFLLSPVTSLLQRLRIGRVPSVILVVVVVFSLLGGIGWGITLQVTSLARELPKHRSNIMAKARALRLATRGGVLEKAQETATEVMKELRAGDRPTKAADKPVPVVMEPPSLLSSLPGVLELLANAGLVIVLVIFMLIRREDIRNRLIRLVGYGRLTATTKALDDAGQRISRYLLMHTITNSAVGFVAGVGLFLIGVPYALLWGFLAAVLRFIPYVGPGIAATLPIVLSLAAMPGWVGPILVIGLFLALELFSNMVLEPWLYGRAAGVSAVGLIVAVAFWTWLWGSLGLLLATPLTVCLVVLSKHVPELDFIVVLLGDEPVMEPSVRYYQRLLAMDHHEATEVVEEHLKTHALDGVYDQVLVPALIFAKLDRGRDRLSEDDEQFIYRTSREIVEGLGSRPPKTSMSSSPDSPGPLDAATNEAGAGSLPRVRILGCPTRDEADELALLMLEQMLHPARCETELMSGELLSSELVARAGEMQPMLICIAALPPEGLAHARYLCKRLRARCPDTRILVGRWGLDANMEEERALLLTAGADHVGTSLCESRDQILQSLAHPLFAQAR